jgi:hypothetical protein
MSSWKSIPSIMYVIDSMVPGGGLEPPRPVKVCGF